MIGSTIRRRLLGSALAAAAACGLVACGGGDAGTDEATAAEVDTLTVWARSNAIGEGLFTPLVDAWNADHDVQVELTLIPSAELPAKIAAAAGASELPDVIVSDVGNLPSLIDQGVLQDIGEQIDGLEYADALAPSAIEQGTVDGVRYAVPADVDPSLMYVNTTLLERAGVTDVPASLDDIEEAATQVTALGDGSYGFYAAGSCGGCLVFTTAPTVWADDGEVVEDGRITIDTPEMAASLQFYQDVWEAGAMPPDSKADTGANWANVFAPGNVAVQFNGSSLLSALKQAEVPFEWDVAGIPGPEGGESSFIGGDTFSVSKDAQSVDAAWEFISWALDEEQQVELYAKNGWLTVRTDLTDNEYNAADPRVQKVNELIEVGRTPRSAYSGQVFNDPTGPWLAAFRAGVYDGDIETALAEGQRQVDALTGG